MSNPFSEVSAAAVAALAALPTPIPSVRTRIHRFSPQHFATTFGGSPAVIVSKGNLERSGDQTCRDSRSASVVLMVSILDEDEGCDPTNIGTLDTFDDYVNAVENCLSNNLSTATYGRAVWTNSSEQDDNDITRGLGEFLTTLELTYRIESTEV